MNEKLKPCPFCHYDDAQVTDGDETGLEFAWCPKCNAQGSSCETQDEAITAWNTRAGEKA
ncbi:Lar family restriction alleviation protein [Acetobacter oryzoeni]|nr:Lar family restriction alleviation protein [Acetobacter oryzoeni]MCP1202744.1 Lar family restriction alleviation protein [Acetobacter oryzoeni]